MATFDLYHFLVPASAALIVYIIAGSIYRLYLSPISSFPGPKLAALTLWYEFYYDVVLGGQYLFHLRDLHAKYGPIIRINPYELHIADSEFYDKLYSSGASGEKRNKWEWYTKQFDTPGSMFSTVDHDHHRMRRSAVNRFFSSSSVKRLQPLVDEVVGHLIASLRAAKGQGKVIKINVAFGAMANDIAQEYAYGQSEHCVEQEDFSPGYHDAAHTAGKLGAIMKQMIWILRLIQCFPDRLVAQLLPDFGLVLGLQQKVGNQVAKVIAELPDAYQHLAHPTIFHEVLQSNLPAQEKASRRIQDEAWIVVGAGTTTTAWALSVATYHLLTSPPILRRLKTELKGAIPERNIAPSIATLENLPYLVAVVQEALRLSYGVASRLQRIAPDPLVFVDSKTHKKWTIPPNTPCSMNSIFVHHDEAIFPDSHSFDPERWIQNPRLSRYLVAFSKGTRQCLGINLAYAELYICLAGMFRRFGSADVQDDEDEGFLELYDTDVSDIAIAVDGFVPLPKNGSKGVRIRVRSRDRE